MFLNNHVNDNNYSKIEEDNEHFQMIVYGSVIQLYYI